MLVEAASADAKNVWSGPGVVWLPVHVADKQKEYHTSNAPEYKSSTMFAIPWCR